jgi:hypothetical protein
MALTAELNMFFFGKENSFIEAVSIDKLGKKLKSDQLEKAPSTKKTHRVSNKDSSLGKTTRSANLEVVMKRRRI